MKKQTAVEWLIEEIQKPNQDVWYWDNIFNQAKAMEKQQIIDANNIGYSASRRDIDETAEQYYTSTFGQ